MVLTHFEGTQEADFCPGGMSEEYVNKNQDIVWQIYSAIVQLRPPRPTQVPEVFGIEPYFNPNRRFMPNKLGHLTHFILNRVKLPILE